MVSGNAEASEDCKRQMDAYFNRITTELLNTYGKRNPGSIQFIPPDAIPVTNRRMRNSCEGSGPQSKKRARVAPRCNTICTCVCACVCVWVCTCVCVCVCICACVWVYTDMYVRMYVYMCIYINICKYIICICNISILYIIRVCRYPGVNVCSCIRVYVLCLH